MTANAFRSFKDAAAGLEAFDRDHWHHEAGGDSIRHTRTHLNIAVRESLEPILNSCDPMAEQAGPEIWEERLRIYLPGRLVEHGLRLARHAAHPSPPDFSNIYFGEDDPGIRGVELNIPIVCLHLHGSLLDLDRACERLEHGKALDSAKRAMVMKCAFSLFYFGLLFGFKLEQRISPTPRDLSIEGQHQLLLELFSKRLEDLHASPPSY
jgi:hypothetical protein